MLGLMAGCPECRHSNAHSRNGHPTLAPRTLALARDWPVSRTPLHAALKVLTAEGPVTLVPGQGGLDRIEIHHEEFTRGEVAYSRSVAALF